MLLFLGGGAEKRLRARQGTSQVESTDSLATSSLAKIPLRLRRKESMPRITISPATQDSDMLTSTFVPFLKVTFQKQRKL